VKREVCPSRGKITIAVSTILLRQRHQFQTHAGNDQTAQEGVGAGKFTPRFGFASGAPFMREGQEQAQYEKRQ
jgi:hypothetical protein